MYLSTGTILLILLAIALSLPERLIKDEIPDWSDEDNQ